jgi:hypothetical protein
VRDPQRVYPRFGCFARGPVRFDPIVVDRDVAGHANGELLNRVGLQLHALGRVRRDPIGDVIFSVGAELTHGQPRKSSCQSARYLSRSLAFTYSQYAVSRFQTCASSLPESCANAPAVRARRIEMFFNIARSYLARRTIAIAAVDGQEQGAATRGEFLRHGE